MNLSIVPITLPPPKLPEPQLPLGFSWHTKYSQNEADFLAPKLLQKYYPPKKLRDYQERDVTRSLALVLQQELGCQLLAPTRTGKTYTISALIYVLGASGYFRECGMNRMPLFEVIVITKATIVRQTQRVLKSFGLIDAKSPARVLVTNYDSLRSSLGELFLKWKLQVVAGEENYFPAWNIQYAPVLIVCDENQSLRNEDTLQSKVIRAWFNLQHTQRMFTFFSSASPFTRPSECRCVIVGCGVRVSNMYGDGFRISEAQFPSWIRAIASNPLEYSPSAMKEIRKLAEHWFIESDGITYKHKSICKHMMLDFPSEESAARYQVAYEEYLEQMANINPDFEEHWYHKVFVAQLKFHMAAEREHSEISAEIAVKLEAEGSSVLIGFAFKDSLEICYNRLIELGFPPEKIGILHGDIPIPKRQDIVDDFQITETRTIMLVTNRTGGVGLSLHHNSEDNNKRPRKVLVTLVWSIIDMLQFLGRAHGPNSESTTYQFSLWFKGTIEEEIMHRLKAKHQSMSELITRKEQYSDLFIPAGLRDKFEGKARKEIEWTKEEEDDGEIVDIDAKLLSNNIEIEEDEEKE